MAQIELPIAAAWMYMSDDQDYGTIPPTWSDIDFTDVHVLYVGPAGIQSSDGTFGLYNTPTTGNLANRFDWIIQTARAQNPAIVIILSQWWGNGNGIWGKALNELLTDDQISTYSDTVAAFIQSYLDVNGGVDGFDIDYESNNVVKNAPTILSQIRTRRDALGSSNGGRQFYVTVSPASTSYLRESRESLDYVNMQTYAGGYGLTPQTFTNLGFDSRQLLYGICPESNCMTRSVQQVEAEYVENQLAGVHLWRLNSDNYVQEGQTQAQVYDFLHPE